MRYKVGQVLKVTTSWHGQEPTIQHILITKKIANRRFNGHVLETGDEIKNFPEEGTFYIETELFC